MAWRLGNGKLRKDQTDHYGRIKNGGGGGASIDDFADSDDIKFTLDSASQKIKAILTDGIKAIINNALTADDIQSSDSIDFSVDSETGKLQATLDTDLNDKIDNSLQAPTETPTATELVGIGTDKDQKRISIGTGLTIENNVLKNTGGGGGGTSDYEELSNKPSINGYTLSGSMTGEDLNLVNEEDLEDYIVKDDAPGYDDILTATSAAATYETIENVGTLEGRVDTVEGDITEIDGDLTTINNELERLDEEKQPNLSSTQLSNINRALVTPVSAPTEKVLIGVDTANAEAQFKLGEGLTVEGTTSPYTIKAAGGGGSSLYAHFIRMQYINSTWNMYLVTKSSEQLNNMTKLHNACPGAEFIGSGTYIPDSGNSGVVRSVQINSATSFILLYTEIKYDAGFIKIEGKTKSITSGLLITDTVIEI